MVDMLKAEDLELAACQASVYTPDGNLSVAGLFRDLLPAWRERFSTEPDVVPHPQMPQPRVLLHDASGTWRCEIAADRADLYWMRTDSDTPAPAIAEFFATASEMLAQYADITRSRVGRLAAIVNRVAGHEAPAQYLADHFCRPALATTALANVESFELNTHKRYLLAQRFEVNAWLSCQTRVAGADAANALVFVHQDLNTLAEDAQFRAFTTRELDEFFTLAAAEHERTLPLFFPRVGS